MKLILSLFLISTSIFSFDHTHKEFDQILKKNVHLNGKQALINYKNILINRKFLDDYTKNLSSVTESEYNSFNSKQKLSYLINAYNAFTIVLIINNYPVKSIKDLGSIFSSAWKKDFFYLFGKKTNLDHLEHGLIRKKFNEPRIHFAVVCASISCPNIQDTAFNESNLEDILDKAESDFFKDSSKNKIYEKDKAIYLSKIFKWYGDDFSKVHGSLEKYLSTLDFPSKKQAKDILNGVYSIKYQEYNWDLNE